MVIEYQSFSTGVPSLFYILVVCLVGLFSFLIAKKPQFWLFLPIVLLAMVIRSAYWYAAPIVGKDTRFHLAVTQYVVETGHIVPRSINYYHFYPVSHTISAVLSKVSGLPVRVAFFLSIGIGTVVGIVIVALLTRRIIPLSIETGDRIPLFAALYLTISPFHLSNSGVLIAQSLMLLLVPLSFLAFLSNDKRIVLIGILATGVTLITHNAPGLIIVGFGFIFIISNVVLSIIEPQSPIANLPKSPHRNPGKIVAATGIGLITYWQNIDFLRLQVARVSRLFRSTPQGSISQAESFNMELGNFLISPILFVAIGLLFIGCFLTTLGLVTIRNSVEDHLKFPINYFSTAAILNITIGITLFAGLDTNIIRLVPLLPVIAAPIVGYIISNVSTKGSLGVVIVLLIMIVLPTSIFVSAVGGGFSVGDAVTEDRPGFERVYMSASELRGAETSSRFADDWTADRYVKSSLAFQNGVNDDVAESEDIVVRQTGWPSSCETFFIRNHYVLDFGIRTSSMNNIILDVGDARLVTC